MTVTLVRYCAIVMQLYNIRHFVQRQLERYRLRGLNRQHRHQCLLYLGQLVHQFLKLHTDQSDCDRLNCEVRTGNDPK